jgi:hypothetical protein
MRGTGSIRKDIVAHLRVKHTAFIPRNHVVCYIKGVVSGKRAPAQRLHAGKGCTYRYINERLDMNDESCRAFPFVLMRFDSLKIHMIA